RHAFHRKDPADALLHPEFHLVPAKPGSMDPARLVAPGGWPGIERKGLGNHALRTLRQAVESAPVPGDHFQPGWRPAGKAAGGGGRTLRIRQIRLDVEN